MLKHDGIIEQSVNQHVTDFGFTVLKVRQNK